jgi:hypothetical protein
MTTVPIGGAQHPLEVHGRKEFEMYNDIRQRFDNAADEPQTLHTEHIASDKDENEGERKADNKG